MKNNIKYLVVLLLIAGVTSGCEDFLSPSVNQNSPTETAVQSEADLEATVYGAYDDMNILELYGRDFYVAGDVMSDNAWSNANSGRFTEHDVFSFTVNSSYALGVWDGFYEVIADANLAIHADVEGAEADAIKGQAYGIRALSHFNLLQAFGQQYVGGEEGVPYMMEYKTAEEAEEGDFIPGRNSVSEVQANIEADLQAAVERLDPESNVPTELDYWAVRALQTRFYLYTEQYDQVVTIAEDIINNGGFEITAADALVETWESGSGPESLFELAFTSTDRLATDNISRIYRNTNYGDVEVTEDLYTSHADDDVRLNLYSATDVSDDDEPEEMSYRMVSKYFDVLGTDNVRIIRYAEVILNYAEALAQPGVTGEMSAVDALNLLADNRYEESPYEGSVTVDEVLEERRLELAMEGQRLYDLLRTGTEIEVGDDNSARTEVIPADDYRVALPIPDAEIRANSNVVQNEGYNN